MTTKSTLVESHSDPDENNGEWPYPTEYKKYLIEGDLADRIRKRTGRTGTVYSQEQVISGGYSEYTQENDYPFSILVDDQQVYETDYAWNSLGDNLDWDDTLTSFTAFNNWLNES